MEDHTHVRAVLLTLASLLVSVSQECTERIHTTENKLDDQSKLLGKILFFCLEEAASVAKLVYETQIFKIYEERYQLSLFSIFRLCLRCIQDAICDSNRQVFQSFSGDLNFLQKF